MEEKTSAKYADSQSHKTHRAVSQKIQKRREAEKKRKKEKKIKESKGKRNKEKRTKKLDKYISKLVRTAGDSWPEILSVFEALDEGAEIGLKSLENEKIKKLLKKVFKLLELGKNSDKEYFRPQGYESIKTKMQNLAKRATSKDKDAPKTARESVSRSDASKSDNSDEDSEDDDDMELEDDIENDDSNKIKNELGGLKTVLRAKPKSKPVVQGDALKVNANITSAATAKKQTYGPARPSGHEDISLDTSSRPSELVGEGLFDALAQGKNYQSDHRTKLRQGLFGPQRATGEPEPVTEAGQQQKLKQYFEDYDKIHRPKTLLELHQEKNRAGKGHQIDDNSFNREDMGYSKVDSRSVFKIVSAAGANLTAKFADGKFKNTFV